VRSMYRISGRHPATEPEMIPSLRRMSVRRSALSGGRFADRRRARRYGGVLTRRYPLPPRTCAGRRAYPVRDVYIAPANGEKIFTGRSRCCRLARAATTASVPRGVIWTEFLKSARIVTLGARGRARADKLFLDDARNDRRDGELSHVTAATSSL